MFALANKDRKKRKKKPLKYDERLACIARAHSADMVRNKFFAHKSPTTGKVGDRLFTAKVKVTSCGENIAMNTSVERAHIELMNSPGHRKNILRRTFTRCGIGIIRADNGLLYATQVFAEPAPEVDLEKLRADIVAKLNKTRSKLGRPALEVSPVLCRLAARQAEAMAKAGEPIALDAGAMAKQAGLNRKRLHVGHIVTWNPEDLAGMSPLLKPQVGQLGLGFAENTEHKELGYGIICAVVLFTND